MLTDTKYNPIKANRKANESYYISTKYFIKQKKKKRKDKSKVTDCLLIS